MSNPAEPLPACEYSPILAALCVGKASVCSSGTKASVHVDDCFARRDDFTPELVELTDLSKLDITFIVVLYTFCVLQEFPLRSLRETMRPCTARSLPPASVRATIAGNRLHPHREHRASPA
jgi:hypothetical protein